MSPHYNVLFTCMLFTNMYSCGYRYTTHPQKSQVLILLCLGVERSKEEDNFADRRKRSTMAGMGPIPILSTAVL